MFSAALERLYAQRAPRHEFEFQNIPSTKVDKQLLVVMDKAKAEKVIIPNPGAMSDNFRYEAGPAFRDSLMNLMQVRFEKVDFADERQPGGPHYDYYRLTDLKDHKIDLGGALWSNKKIQCLYRLYVS